MMSPTGEAEEVLETSEILRTGGRGNAPHPRRRLPALFKRTATKERVETATTSSCTTSTTRGQSSGE